MDPPDKDPDPDTLKLPGYPIRLRPRIRRRKSLIPWRRRAETGYLDRRIGDELQSADDEDEHLHDVSVAAEHVGEGVLDLGLDLVPIELGGSSQFDEDERERIEPIRPRPNTHKHPVLLPPL
ncbi:hypothetical protein F2Q69_00034247 [Brassica cretica]|uniref:Uncharacterized protein n=1 Tax=Brassica cretica TaxID=69181 RepID=A0A8S9SIU5_BRACR|nr:hypothetical protein F2Q69_00034247 [Brassica cretica]